MISKDVQINIISIEKFEKCIYNKYTKLFPEDEQREWVKIRRSYKLGIEKFYEIAVDKETVGFFMLEKLNEEMPYYIDYFAIFKEYQNKGYGKQAIKILMDTIIIDSELCLEIESFHNEIDNTNRKRRANFYEDLGFQRIASEYLLYDVLYIPYFYSKNAIPSKDEVDRIMFQYYKFNCGAEDINRKFKKVF